MRMDDPGFGTISTNSFPIQQTPVVPIPVGSMTASEIETLFSYLPEGGMVSQSGAAHTEAGRILASIAEVLIRHVNVLHENWSGTAAQTAVGAFEQLHQTAIGLAQNSTQTGAVLSWLGGLITPLNSYKAPGKGTASDQAAQATMNEFNANLVAANSNLPTKVTKNLPTSADFGTLQALMMGPAGGVAAGAAAAAASPTGADGGVSPAPPAGGSQVTPVGANPGGGTGPVTGVSPNPGTGSPAPVSKLAGLPPGGGSTGTGTGTPPGNVPGGGAPGGTTGPTGPTGVDPVGTVPVPTGTPGTGNSGNPAPGDGDVEPAGVGSVPGEGGAPGVGGFTGESPDPAGLVGVPGANGDPGVGGFTGESPDPAGLVGVPGANGDPGVGGFTGQSPDPAGLGTVPGEDGGVLPMGSMPGDPGVGGFGGGSGGFSGNGAGGSGLVAEDITGESPADGAVIGPDGMIGTGPGGLDAGLGGGFGSSEVGVGNSGATGFVGADDAFADPAAGSGGGFPMAGGPGSGEQARERRRQAWMMEDADLWEGEAEHVPSQIGA
jgi:hypothetical protein